MVKEAELHSDEDKKKKELIEARNQADGLVYTTEKTLKEHGDQVDDETKAKIETALEELKKAIEGDDKDEINAKVETLAQSAHKLAEAMYAKAEAEGEAGAAGATEESVVDAEFEDVADDKEETDDKDEKESK